MTLTTEVGTAAELGIALAEAHQDLSTQRPEVRVRRRLKHIGCALDEIGRRLREESGVLPLFAEWFLDNEYLLAQAVDQVRVDLPPSFETQLPVLSGEREPRILTVARELVRSSQGHVDLERSVEVLTAYQTVTPLSMGELWAFPTTLRLAVLEDLVEVGLELTGPGDDAHPGHRVPGSIETLRGIDAEDWKVFFEEVSRVEHILRESDPAAVYARMDFETRDRYRKVVEAIARRSGVDEEEVATRAGVLSEDGSRVTGRDHVGHFLLGSGRDELERAFSQRGDTARRVARRLGKHSLGLYLGGIAALAALVLRGLLEPLAQGGAGPDAWLIGIVLGVIPATTVSIAILQHLLTYLTKPTVLPKMDYTPGLPESVRAFVVIPALLTSSEEIEELLRQLELHHQGNRDPNLRFALLSDLEDAPRSEMPGDAELLGQALNGIQALNRRYTRRGYLPFLLLHRRRLWNTAEGCWMGWERKRGKLDEFNRLALGSGQTGFTCLEGDIGDVVGIRYVITLDADTVLPQGAAHRLIATLDHPLNRPRFDRRGRVVSGYTVLQPRIETLQAGSARTLFTKIFEADRGLDLYSHAVSDVYQDLFGVGIYAGKGIYDIAAFDRSLNGRVPENTLLSHDLFEGVHGRAGLVTDVAVFEDFPPTVTAYARRLHRWVRGDWQIAPWLLPKVPGEDGRWVANPISLLGRWQIADNLRRSLLSPSLLLLLASGWLLLPGGVVWWTSMSALVLGIPVFLGAALTLRPQAMLPGRWAPLIGAGRLRWAGALRWAFAFAFLPYQAALELDAIIRTVLRVTLTKRHLLEWTTAAHAARSAQEARRRLDGPGVLWAPSVTLALTLLVWLREPTALVFELPILSIWALAPVLAQRISRPPATGPKRLSEGDLGSLRVIARRTWSFFEDFVSSEDHWLPPDHFQEEPRGKVAHRTSPTNIGLFLLSALAAFDFGYLGVGELLATFSNTLDGMGRLRRHRGHILNWYDTRSLEPLAPEYVSTVDSGNLAAALICVARGSELLRHEVFPRDVRPGLRDTLEVLEATLTDTAAGPLPPDLLESLRAVDELLTRPVRDSRELCAIERDLALDFIPELHRLAVTLVGESVGHVDPRVLTEVRAWMTRLDQQAQGVWQETLAAVPWLTWPEELPEGLVDDPSSAAHTEWRRLCQALPATVPLQDISGVCSNLRVRLEQPLSGAMARVELAIGSQDLVHWIRKLDQDLEAASEWAHARLEEMSAVTGDADRAVAEMDFGFLYDPKRRLFRIGYNLVSGQLDTSYYDLLASEARIASLVAIAKGDVPVEHWLYLGRPFGRVYGRAALLSWAGTSFEYLMPALLTHVPQGSLLDLTSEAIVFAQMRYGRRHGSPWGISESAYHHTDVEGTYQYRAFGVPMLGLRRETGSRLVISPYASILAASVAPSAVLENVERLKALGAMGRYGLYEAVDYGSVQGPSGGRPKIVRSFMAHHQGMILVALDNLLKSGAMPRRFHADSTIAAVEFLLHENGPGRVRLEPPRAPPAPPGGTKGAQPRRLDPWEVPFDGVRPEAQVLSNGSLNSFIDSRGGGGMRWRGMQMTRWSPDPTRSRGGTWLYVQEPEHDTIWSPTAAPTWSEGTERDVLFAPHQVEFDAHRDGLAARLAITVAPGMDVEIRRLSLHNDGKTQRRLRVTSYGEVSLSDPQQDRRHPAFQKLFVEGAYVGDRRALVYRKRRASPEEPPLYLAHGVVLRDGQARLVGWETDRERFLGRNGSMAGPEALRSNSPGLTRTTGATLDPIFSLQVEVQLGPGDDGEMAFLTAAGRTRKAVLHALDSYGTLAQADWAFEEARTHCSAVLQTHGLSLDHARSAQALLTLLAYPNHDLRSSSDGFGVASTRLALWSIGVSGDVPVLLLRVTGSTDRPNTEELLRIHAYLRRAGVKVDLVILDESSGSYSAPFQDWLERRIIRMEGAGGLKVPGGVHPVSSSQLSPEVREAVEAAAAVVLDSARGNLSDHLDGIRRHVDRLPPFIPVPTTPPPTDVGGSLPPLEPVVFDNGIGGFSMDGHEYQIRLPPGTSPPAPWINVIAQPHFGFTVSERGSGCTWAENSGERRLTSWSNDPVLDPPSEALYFRDEETGDVWSPTPGPAPGPGPYEARHGAGTTSFRHVSHGLEQRTRLHAHPERPVKIVEVEAENRWDRPRRLTLTYYAEWVLGDRREVTAPHISTRFDGTAEMLLAINRFSESSPPPLAFLASDHRVHGWTADREEFLGAEGGLANPEGLRRIGLAVASGSGLDPCGALQVHLEIGPAETVIVRFFLGSAGSPEEARELVDELRNAETVERATTSVETFWNELLSTLTVETPDKSMDLLLNRWLLYQAVSCRLYGRTALYQSSGAYGFRDQLQDVLCLLTVAPDVARAHILEAASHQFPEGDVLHWWHPPDRRGVRTRCSDDLLWLPYVVAHYVSATSDRAILDQEVSFLDGAPLSRGEEERYGHYGAAPAAGSLFDHCMRALRRGITRGPRGLPLMGGFDWNDGLNRVGVKGTGESAWLGWFVHDVATRFATVCESVDAGGDATWLRDEARRIGVAMESVAWDGEWYQRATYDDGTPLGSETSQEGRIDSIAQSWAVLSGAGAPERARQAMDSVTAQLVDRDRGLVLLLKPPFDRTEHWPGYIKAYPPGIRENGGQYNHAASWVGFARAALGDGDGAWEIFQMLDPIRRTCADDAVANYRVEPYVIAGDVAGAPPHSGRGGWTWYTGSAAWAYRLGVEAILGVRLREETLCIDPCIPRCWEGFTVTFRRSGTTYRIRVRNPEGVCGGVRRMHVDGEPLPDNQIPLRYDGLAHEVDVLLG